MFDTTPDFLVVFHFICLTEDFLLCGTVEQINAKCGSVKFSAVVVELIMDINGGYKLLGLSVVLSQVWYLMGAFFQWPKPFDRVISIITFSSP